MEQLKQHYQDRLNALHQFLYCELPLKLMNNDDESNSDLQDKLYHLVETGYVKDLEARLQKLIEENFHLSNKENCGKDRTNILAIDQLNVEKQKLVIETKMQKRQIIELQEEIENLKSSYMRELDEKNSLFTEIQEKLEHYHSLSDGLMRAERALSELTEENMQLSVSLEKAQQEALVFKAKAEELQHVVQSQEVQHSREEVEIKENIQILEHEFNQWELKKARLISVVRALESYLKEQLNQQRIELHGIQAETKIRVQILEQFKSQLGSDLLKGFHQILHRYRTESTQEIQELKAQLLMQKDEYQGQINKLKKDIQFYKVLEEEYEQKLNEALNNKNEYANQLQLKEDQLIEIMNKLDTVQLNIQQTEDFYRNQIGELENARDRKAMQFRQFKGQMKLKVHNIWKQFEMFKSFQEGSLQKFEEMFAALQAKLSDENQTVVEGLTKEIQQSIETIKKLHNQIKILEIENIQLKTKEQLQLVEHQKVQQNESFSQPPNPSQRSSTGLDEQRRYLNTLKEIHRNTKSQIRSQRKF